MIPNSSQIQAVLKDINKASSEVGKNLNELVDSQNEIIDGLCHLHKCLEVIAKKLDVKLPEAKDINFEVERADDEQK